MALAIVYRCIRLFHELPGDLRKMRRLNEEKAIVAKLMTGDSLKAVLVRFVSLKS